MIKRLLYILLVILIFISCSKNDDFPEKRIFENGFFIRRRSIKSTLNGFWVGIVIFHVIGKYHELGEVDKLPEFLGLASTL